MILFRLVKIHKNNLMRCIDMINLDITEYVRNLTVKQINTELWSFRDATSLSLFSPPPPNPSLHLYLIFILIPIHQPPRVVGTPLGRTFGATLPRHRPAAAVPLPANPGPGFHRPEWNPDFARDHDLSQVGSRGEIGGFPFCCEVWGLGFKVLCFGIREAWFVEVGVGGGGSWGLFSPTILEFVGNGLSFFLLRFGVSGNGNWRSLY